MTRGLKFRIQEVEGLYYLCSENKGADQLRGYREADLRLCFRYAKSRFSHDAAQYKILIKVNGPYLFGMDPFISLTNRAQVKINI